MKRANKKRESLKEKSKKKGCKNRLVLFFNHKIKEE